MVNFGQGGKPGPGKLCAVYVFWYVNIYVALPMCVVDGIMLLWWRIISMHMSTESGACGIQK